MKVFLIVLCILVVILIFGIIMSFFPPTKECKDCGKKTSYGDMVKEKFLCVGCQWKRKMDEEPKILCPKCPSIEMDKKRHTDVIYDKCPNCEGIWLDKGKLNKISDEDIDIIPNQMASIAASAIGTGVV